MPACDACRRPAEGKMANIQIQHGEMVPGDHGGPQLRHVRRPRFYLLCPDCCDYVMLAAHYLIGAGGHEALRRAAAGSQVEG